MCRLNFQDLIFGKVKKKLKKKKIKGEPFENSKTMIGGELKATFGFKNEINYLHDFCSIIVVTFRTWNL